MKLLFLQKQSSLIIRQAQGGTGDFLFPIIQGRFKGIEIVFGKGVMETVTKEDIMYFE